MIEDNIEYPLHDIIIEACKETYDKISMVCGDTRPCSPHVDEGLEILLPCNILPEEDCYEYKEDMDRQEHDAMDEESPTYDMDGSDDYWNFIDNPNCENLMENPIQDMSNKGSVYSKICGSPIYDTSIEGSTDLDSLENLSMEEEHSESSHDHSESYHAESHKGNNNENIEK